jgi:hypothetical protein
VPIVPDRLNCTKAGVLNAFVRTGLAIETWPSSAGPGTLANRARKGP